MGSWEESRRCLKVLREGWCPEWSCERVTCAFLGRVCSALSREGAGLWRTRFGPLLASTDAVKCVCVPQRRGGAVFV